jgi:2-methylisocitrate lyase-like PEP mutase family enzyme
MRTVASSVKKPLNVVMSAADPALTAAQLAQAGVKRISIGGALSRLALASVLRAAHEMKEQGGFTWIADSVSAKELKRLFHGS